MPVIPAGYAQANHLLRLVGDNELMIVTMGIKLSFPLHEDLEETASDLFDAFVTCWDAFVINFYAFHGVDYTANVGTGNIVTNFRPAEVVSSNAIGGMTQNVAYLFKKNTLLGGRANKGRGYVPGVGEENVDNAGNLTSGTITAANAALEAWRVAIEGAAGVDKACVLHSSAGPSPADISSMTIDPRVATQRRRLR